MADLNRIKIGIPIKCLLHIRMNGFVSKLITPIIKIRSILIYFRSTSFAARDVLRDQRLILKDLPQRKENYSRFILKRIVI